MSGAEYDFAAGRTTPAAPETPLSHLAPGSRFPQLDDRDWWLRHGSKSDIAIGLLLGCHRDTVRAARRRNGIAAPARGRRRGSTTRRATVTISRPAAELIAELIAEQGRPAYNGPAGASRTMLASRVRALNDAFATGDRAEIKSALIELGAGCGLVADQLDRLEAA